MRIKSIYLTNLSYCRSMRCVPFVWRVVYAPQRTTIVDSTCQPYLCFVRPSISQAFNVSLNGCSRESYLMFRRNARSKMCLAFSLVSSQPGYQFYEFHFSFHSTTFRFHNVIVVKTRLYPVVPIVI